VGRNREVGLTTTLWAERSGDWIPLGGGKIFLTGSDEATQSSAQRGNAVKRLGCDVNHSIPFNDEVKEKVELYFYTPFGSSWLVTGWTVPFTFSRQFGTRHVRKRKESGQLKLLRFWAFTVVSYCKKNKRLGIKSEKSRRQPPLPLDLSNEPSWMGASPHSVSRVEYVQFPIRCGLLEAAC
jgi:hypothetical protein